MLVQRNGLDSTESTEPSHSGVELLLQSETSFVAPAPHAVSCQKVCDPAGGSWDRMGQSPSGGGDDWSRASFRWSLFSGQTGVGGGGPPLFLKACSSDLSFLSGGWKVTSPPTPAVCVRVCARMRMFVFLHATMHRLLVFLAQEGEIWPNIPILLNIVFRPEEAKIYQETIYCDVTGEFLPPNPASSRSRSHALFSGLADPETAAPLSFRPSTSPLSSSSAWIWLLLAS